MTIQIQDIKEHMEVLGSDGKHVGTVDCTEGRGQDRADQERSAVRRAAPYHSGAPGAALEEDKVHLNKPARQVMLEWQAAA